MRELVHRCDIVHRDNLEILSETSVLESGSVDVPPNPAKTVDAYPDKGFPRLSEYMGDLKTCSIY